MTNNTEKKVTESEDKVKDVTQDPSLTVQDLQSLKAIIDVASSRGAFKPNEMIAVGQTYNKLEQFLASISPKEEQ